MSGTLTTQQAVRVSDFLNSIGICGDANATTAAQLSYLGIDHLRTTVTSSANLLAAGADGAKIDVIAPTYMLAINDSSLANFLSGTIDPAASVIEAVEGPNEVNYDPDTFDGLSGPASIEAEQESLYKQVESDTNLNNANKTTVVYNFSVLQGTPDGTYSGMANYATYNNVHAYAGAGAQPSWTLPYEVSNNTIAGTDPTVVTETGEDTMPGVGVDQATQARFDVDALLDDYQLGVVRTYLYNLQDWNTGSAVNDFSAYYGLYNADGTLKEAGTALHNLTTILGAGNSATSTVGTPGSLAYLLTGQAYYSNSELMQKSDGAFDLALWNETTMWNAATNSEVAVPTNQETLTLGGTYASISVYDPLESANPIQTVTNASSITVGLSADPLIVEIVPQDTITLAVSEDAYAGDAQFQVTVDGQAVGPLQDAHALNGTGVSQYVTLTGDWGPGNHQIGLSYVNDLSAGTPTTDRNFYVTDISYDGNLMVGSQANFYWDGTKNFTTVGSQPNAAPPQSDTISLQLSEDAWQGDAQFVLLLDGKAVTTPQAVTALHSSGLSQDFTFGLNIPSGSHTIGVQYMNDTAAGPGEDRNLYVGSVAVDGQTIGASNVPLYWNGTANYSFTK